MTIVDVISWACAVLFLLTAAITLLALIGWLRLGTSAQEHKYYVRRLFNALIIEVLAVGVTVFATSVRGQVLPPNVVPPPETVKVAELPSGSNPSFSLLRDVSVFDLRGWKQVPPGQEDRRVSPAHFLNYLHVKKRAAANTFIAHYATSGAALDLRCITHTARTYEETKRAIHQGEKNYGLEIDVSFVPVDQEFLVVVEGTYWNAFVKPTETASTYTDADITALGELGLIVLFPTGKSFRSFHLSDTDEATNTRREVRTSTAFYPAKDGSFLYWNITSRSPNHHYTVTWTW